MAAGATTGSAGTIYTFGADTFGAPTSLNSMNPSSSSSVTNVQTPVGDGNTGFNGGLVAYNNLLYAIGNDNNNFATLYSMGTNGGTVTSVSFDFNTSGPATGYIFQNGLAAVSGTFYAIGAGSSSENLFQIGSGTATDIASLNTFGGTYAGLAWDPTLAKFYGIISNASVTDTGDLLVSVTLSGAVTEIANLTTLDSSQIGTHLGGLADAGGGILYDIYTNPATQTGQLEQINLNGTTSATTLYDTGIPLAQNAGIATILPATSTPEPGPGFEVGAALLLLGGILRRFPLGRRNP
jgi:hypothetical protein